MAEKRTDAKEKSDRAARLKQQRHEAHKRYYAKTANMYPARPWTEEEIQLVMEHSIPDSELSEKLGRSMKSIQEKRGRVRRWREAGEPGRRPSKTIPEMSECFYESVRLWKEGRITCMEAAKRCGMPNSTFRYRAGVKCGGSTAQEERCVAEQLSVEEYKVEQDPAVEYTVEQKSVDEYTVDEYTAGQESVVNRPTEKG